MLLFLLAGDALDSVSDYLAVQEELFKYDQDLIRKHQVVVVNKVDLAQTRAQVAEITARFQEIGKPVCFISAQTGQGVEDVIGLAVSKAESIPPRETETIAAVFRPKPRSGRR